MKKIACLLLVLSTMLAGCTLFVKDPVVTVKGLDVVSVDGGGAGMELRLSVKNPNPFDIRLRGFSYDLKVMALPLAKGGVLEGTTFPSGAETELRVPIRVSFGELLALVQSKPNFDAVPYVLSAGLDLDTPLGKVNLPVNRTGTYAVPPKYRPAPLLNKLSDFFRMNR